MEKPGGAEGTVGVGEIRGKEERPTKTRKKVKRQVMGIWSELLNPQMQKPQQHTSPNAASMSPKLVHLNRPQNECA